MIFTNALSLILVLAPATIFAAPTKTSGSIADVLTLTRRHLPADIVSKLEDGACDLSGASMPIAPTPLPSPAAGLKLAHVAFGRGTQNYTCKSAAPTETPVAVGAMAQLYNVTCQAVRAPAVLADIPSLALKHGLPNVDITERLLTGHHDFTAAGVPLFNLNTDRFKYGTVQAKKDAASSAPVGAPKGPNGLGSVAWLKLTATEGDYKEVYRINTAGGQAPKTCEGMEGNFEVEYSTLYYFWN